MGLLQNLRRGINRPLFKISIVFSFIFAVSAIFLDLDGRINYSYEFFRGVVIPPVTRWMGVLGFTVAYILELTYPLLAAMAYSDIFWEDRKTGLNQVILTKINQRKYYISNYLAGFILGGIAGIAALTINIMLMLLIFPAISVNQLITEGIFSSSQIFAELYYSNSLLYVLARLGILFLWSGLISVFSMGLSFIFSNRYLPMIVPMFFLLIVDMLTRLIVWHGGIGSQFIIGGEFTFATFFSAALIIIFIALSFIVGHKRNEKFE